MMGEMVLGGGGSELVLSVVTTLFIGVCLSYVFDGFNLRLLAGKLYGLKICDQRTIKWDHVMTDSEL